MSYSKRTISFIGIGAQKAGTTWLYDRLSELPAFDLPPKKEIHFFDASKSYPSPSFLAEHNFPGKALNPSWLRHFSRDFPKLFGDNCGGAALVEVGRGHRERQWDPKRWGH